MQFGCRKCGTILLCLNDFLQNPAAGHHSLPYFIEVTEHWPEIKDWYNNRRKEIQNHASELEMQLMAEVPEH